MATLGAVVLAAGKSERMGRNKFLLPWGKGLAGEKILHTLSSCGLSQIVLILGFDGDSILSTLAPTIKGRKVEAVFNPHYEEGMISSVKTGVKGLRGDLDGFFLVLGDQPFLKAEWIAKLKDFFSTSGALAVIPTYKGKRGHPLLLSLRLREEIMALDERRETLKTLLRRHSDSIQEVEFSEEEILWDLDTPEEVERYKNSYKEE